MNFVRMLFHKSILFVNHEGVELAYRAGEYYHIAEADVEKLLAVDVAKTEQMLEQLAAKADAAAAEDREKAKAAGAGDPEVEAPPAQ